jgi:hypothetical protein
LRSECQKVRGRFTSDSIKGNIKFKLDLLGVQEARRKNCVTELAEGYKFFYGKWNENHELGTDIFVHKRIISTVKSVEFVIDVISYIILRNRWCSERSCPNRG